MIVVRKCRVCLMPARTLEQQLALEQFRGCCEDCAFHEVLLDEATVLARPEWMKPAADNAQRLQGERAA